MTRPLDHARTAAAFDLSDPFTFARTVTHIRHAGAANYDYSRSRRLPAKLEDRFTLGKRRVTNG